MPKVNQPVLGILGGGQLSLMLVDAAKRLGLNPLVYLTSKDDPASVSASQSIIGSLTKADDLKAFLDKVDTLVFENEFLSEAFREVAQSSTTKFVPAVDAIYNCSDKLHQKRILQQLGIPTPRYQVVAEAQDERSWLQVLVKEFPDGFVLKWARLGYDGYGVLVLRPEEIKSKLSAAEDFIIKAKARGITVFAEALISFERELAMVCARSVRGEVAYYPLVISKQVDGRCSEVLGPAATILADTALDADVRGYVQKIGEGLDLYGTFAVEFFQDCSGQVFVNEVAPRVHNSGHYTQDAAAASQFENHWRAVLGMELGSTQSAPYFGMLNILGPADYKGPIQAPRLTADAGVLHWYHKAQSTPGRKLGHINFVATTEGELKTRREAVQRALDTWSSSYRK